MRKILCIFAIILGVIIIGAGVLLQTGLINNSSSDEEKPTNLTSSTNFQRINKFNKEEYCSTYKPIETFINTNDYTKISFNYPDCVHEYNLSFWYKTFTSEDGNVSIDIKKDKETLTNYMNNNKTDIVAKKNEDEYYNLEYTETFYTTTKDGKKVGILEVNYQYKFITTTTYDEWYIGIELSEEMILIIEITAKEKVFSYKAVQEIINSIIIEPDAAKYKNSTVQGNKQVGTIILNKNKEYDHGYKLTYEVDTKYPEVDSYGSDFDESTFEFENINESFYANINLDYDSFYDTLKEKAEAYKKASSSTYSDTTTYRNVKDSDIITKTINGKKITYFIYSYDYYTQDAKTKSYTGYKTYAYYEIAPDYYYCIHISTNNIEINEAVISEFLNINVEEY